MLISLIGGAIGLALSQPIAKGFQSAFPTIFPIMPDPTWTLIWGGVSSLFVGLLAALFPVLRVSRMRIVDGLRHID
jgi:putative ABC transport system permease protein